MSHRIAVVGAGLGGFSAAIRLQARGWDVTVFEKNNRPGGRMNLIDEKGFKIDMGPTLVMMPEMLHEVFEAANRKLEDYLDLVQLTPSYKVQLGDGSVFNMTSALTELVDQLEKRSPDDARRFFNYFQEIHQKYRLSREYFIEKTFNSLSDMVNPQTLKGLFSAKPFGTVTSFTKKYIKDPYLRAAFTFQTLYLGVSPHQCPSVYSLLPYIELAEGVWFPRGGVYQIAKAFEKLFLELGGEIRYKHPVDSFQFDGRRITGIYSKDRFFPAQAVICNQDTGKAFKDLIPEAKRPSAPDKKVDRLDYGCSSLMIYLGVNKKYDDMAHHTVVLPRHFDDVLDDLFKQGVPPAEPAYYICRPTATDSGLAPQGCDVIYLLVPVPHLKQYNRWDKTSVELYKNSVLSQVERDYLPGLRQHIELEKVFTPGDFKTAYGIMHGSAFGLSPSFFQSAYFRPRNVSPDIDNLYFAGASTHPGGGIPVVLLSGRLVADEIASRTNKPPQKEPVVSEPVPVQEELPEPVMATE